MDKKKQMMNDGLQKQMMQELHENMSFMLSDLYYTRSDKKLGRDVLTPKGLELLHYHIHIRDDNRDKETHDPMVV